jgi:OOP family OmpA-OmpF porin
MKKKISIVPIMKRIAPVMLVSLFLLPLTARAEIKAGSVEVNPFAGYNFFENRQNLENSVVYGGRLGYNFTNTFGVEAVGEFNKTHVDDKTETFRKEGMFTTPIDTVRISTYHLDLLYHFMPESKFNPFIAVGYGAAHYDPKINNKNMSVINYGVGAKYWVADNIALRADVRDNLIYDEKLHNVEVTAGVVFAFGGKTKAAPVAVAAPLDSDRDGVTDSLDRCPDTPAGVAVDTTGCPLDTDKDGVADYLDKCPGTPAGVAVDRNGCPPVAKQVVILASEPKVEERVRAAVVQPAVVVLAFEDIHFEFDKSTLTPEAKTILKRNILVLKENPKAKVRIAGYTSAAGTEEYNQALSERRAKSVQDYLISEGVITKSRLVTVGHGENDPAAYEAAPKDIYSEAAKANIRVLFEVIVE